MTTQPQPEQSVNDGSECYATWTGNDANGNPYIPTSLQYRIDDITNNISILPWTPLTPAQSVEVTITSTQNIMSAMSRTRERRQVLFEVGIPSGSVRYDDTTYVLVRKTGTP